MHSVKHNVQFRIELAVPSLAESQCPDCVVGLLTYMSTKAQISSLEVHGKLRRFKPRSRYPAKRRLFLARQAVTDLTDPNSTINVFGLRGYIEAAMAKWVLGGHIYAGFMKRLCPPPPEIWEIRVTVPSIQVRVFCRFAEPDTLIVTGMHTRQMLGKKGSAAWQNAMFICEACWDSLFPNMQPFSGAGIRDYVTESCDDIKLCG